MNKNKILAESLTDYDKFIIKHLNAEKWLASLEKDYAANGLPFPSELQVAQRWLLFTLNRIGEQQLEVIQEGN